MSTSHDGIRGQRTVPSSSLSLALASVVLAVASLQSIASSAFAGAGPAPGDLSITASTTKVEFRENVTLIADFESGGVAVDDVSLELWRRDYGGTWVLAGTDETNAFGTASLQHTPRKKTSYQWRFNGNEDVGYTESAIVTVRVHAKLTLKIKDPSLRPGQRLVVTGRTVPAKPGVTIRLYRARISGVTDLWFSGTVRSDGTYKLTRTVRQIGTWRLYTRIPAALGNLGTESNSEWLDVG